MSQTSVAQELEALYRCGVAAVDAGAAVRRALQCEDGRLSVAGRDVPGESRVILMCAGKAAASMAEAAEEVLGDRIRLGMVVTKDGHAAAHSLRLPVRESSHPVPDARGETAARELLALASGSHPDDLILLLLSGGASALTGCPAPGLELSDLEASTMALLQCGADIEEMNAVRKHLSAIAGGRLAVAAKARHIEALVISDVRGDRLDIVASGPCEPDPSTYGDALAVLDAHAIRARIPARVLDHLECGHRGERPETPKPGDPRLGKVRSTLIACNGDARQGVMAAARGRGLHPISLGESIQGEAAELGRRLAALGASVRASAPTLLVAGGESVVTLKGSGRGGRSQELALAAAIELERLSQRNGTPGSGVSLLAAGTDGGDGATDAAGAYADAGSCRAARAAGVDPRLSLQSNDSHRFFEAAGGLLVTGPTGTNVMDLVLMRIGPASAGQ